MIQHPGQARREAWPCHEAKDPGPKELTGLSASRAARMSARALTCVPLNFNWHTCLLYHPELRDLGVDSDELACKHYVHQGHMEVLIPSC